MRTLTLIIWLCLNAIPAFAQRAEAVGPCSACGLHAAPAPVIGLGLPVYLGLGGVLLGFKLLQRRR